MNCFRKTGFAEDAGDAEGRNVSADVGTTDLWSSVNGGDGDASGLQEFLIADHTVAKNEDLNDEAIVAAVTGTEGNNSDDELEFMQVMSHQEAFKMIDSLSNFFFVKNLLLSYVQ